jgi:hypothetical protein
MIFPSDPHREKLQGLLDRLASAQLRSTCRQSNSPIAIPKPLPASPAAPKPRA